MTATPRDPANISIPDLRAELDGDVIAPGEPGYDERRTVFLKGIDRRPAVIAQPANDEDVARLITLARENGLEVAVRGGGHSRAGHGTSEGGIVLDLSGMRAVEIDAEARTAWAETGLTTGEYSKATGANGLATGFGDAGAVGIGGITLGGGLGYLVRRNGLTIDDLLAADVVTADGQVLRVDAETHPDLFWALRGGGGNFGVATRLQLRLHEIDEIVGGMMLLPATPETIVAFIDAAEAAPEGLSTIANVMLAPPMPFVPAEYHGQPVLMVLMAFSGEVADGERAIAPLRSVAQPVADMLRPMRYPELYEGPEGPSPIHAAARTGFVDGLDRSSAEAILDQIQSTTATRAVAQLRVLGGAMARVPVDATAFAHRDRRIMTNLVAMYEDPEEGPVHEAWAKDIADAVGNGGGAYVGFLGEEDEATVRASYPGSTWDRLREIKARYDPANLFRLNQNIPPATG